MNTSTACLTLYMNTSTTMLCLQYAAEKCIQIHFVAIAQNNPEDTVHSEANLATFAAELCEFESASASYCPCGERVDQCHQPACISLVLLLTHCMQLGALPTDQGHNDQGAYQQHTAKTACVSLMWQQTAMKSPLLKQWLKLSLGLCKLRGL